MKNECVFLYLLRCDDFFKIGITSNIKARMKDYRCMNPKKIDLLKTMSFRNRFFARTAEKISHDYLKRAGKHHRGEWFKDCSIHEIEDALNHAKLHANCEVRYLKYKISQRLKARNKYQKGVNLLAKKEKAIKCKKITEGIDMTKEINVIGVKRLAILSGVKQSSVSDMRKTAYSGYYRCDLVDLSSVVSSILKEKELTYWRT